MGRITALHMDGKKKRVSVFVDGAFSFDIDRVVAGRVGLQAGQCLSVDRIEELTQADISHSCFEAALHYLSYRPRSEAEVRRRLYRGGFSDDVVSKVIAGLKERKLIEDVVFAQFWKDNRQAFSPRSRQLIELELRQKGVAAETAGEITGGLDDGASAYEAGLKKSRVSANLDYDEFRRRLSGHLRRRGFSYEVISQVVTRLWQEQQTASG